MFWSLITVKLFVQPHEFGTVGIRFVLNATNFIYFRTKTAISTLWLMYVLLSISPWYFKNERSFRFFRTRVFIHVYYMKMLPNLIRSNLSFKILQEVISIFSYFIVLIKHWNSPSNQACQRGNTSTPLKRDR